MKGPKGSFKGDIDIDINIDIEGTDVEVDIDSYLGCLKRVSKAVQVLCSGIEAVMLLTLIILKWRALHVPNYGYSTIYPKYNATDIGTCSGLRIWPACACAFQKPTLLTSQKT